MKTLYVVYFSHLGTTGRFVHKHLVPALREAGRTVVPHQVMSSGPHQPINDRVAPLFSSKNSDRQEFLLVFPCYGRTNPHTGYLEDMVPMPIRDVIERIETEALGDVVGGVICGNRTFGPDFTNVEGQFAYSVLGRVELAGSRTDANEAVQKLTKEKK